MSMEISNAAQGGPTHGLLDLLFGTGSTETKPSSAEPEDPLMALVKALEKQNKSEDEKAEFVWSDLDSGTALNPNEQIIPLLPQATGPGQNFKIEGTTEPDQDLLNIVGGNLAAAKLLQNLQPDPQALKALKSGDPQAIMKLIEARKQELKVQMPSLALLEKAVDREGLEKIANTKDVQQLITKLEQDAALQEKNRKGITTEDFLLAKLAKDQKSNLAGDATSPFGMASTQNKINLPSKVAIPNDVTPIVADTTQRSQAIEQKVANILQQVDGKAPVGDAILAGAATSVGMSATVGDNPTSLMTLDIQALRNNDHRADIAGRIANSISLIAKKGGGEMAISINPKELGEIQLRVKTNGQSVEVQIVTQNHEVAQALRNSGGDLADALTTRQLNLSGLDVTVRGGDSQMNADAGNQNSQNARYNFDNQDRSNQQNSRGFAQNDGDNRRESRAQSNFESLASSDITLRKSSPYLANGRLDTKA